MTASKSVTVYWRGNYDVANSTLLLQFPV